jgi:hypothetical protein
MQQTNFKCSAGNVRIHSATMRKLDGHDNHLIEIEVEFSGNKQTIQQSLRDAKLWQLLQSMPTEEDRAAHILRTFLAQEAIEWWVNSLKFKEEEGKVADEIVQYFGGVSNVDLFMANTGISSDKKGQVLEILMDAENKWQRSEGKYSEQTEAIDAIIEETSKKLAAL